MVPDKGYTVPVELDDEAGLFDGEVLDTRDVVTFQGRSVDEIETAFCESIDETLAFCAECGEAPDRPFSGWLVLGLSKDLRRNVPVGARRAGKSPNLFVVDRLHQTS